jgi:hypothetical protein
LHLRVHVRLEKPQGAASAALGTVERQVALRSKSSELDPSVVLTATPTLVPTTT